MVDLASLQSDPCLQKSRRTARDLNSKQHNPSLSSFSQHHLFPWKNSFYLATWQLPGVKICEGTMGGAEVGQGAADLYRAKMMPFLSFKAIWSQGAFRLDELHCSISQYFLLVIFLLFQWGDWDVLNVKPYQNSMKFQLFEAKKEAETFPFPVWAMLATYLGLISVQVLARLGRIGYELKKTQHFEKHIFF